MMRTAALFILALAALCMPARAEKLVTAISADTVSIESNFTGAEIVIFGTIERDTNSISRRQGHDLIIAVRGPANELTVRRKERVAGIWVNSDSRTYKSVPSFLAVLSNRAPDDIAAPFVLEKYRLTLDSLGLEPPPEAAVAGTNNAAFRDAVVRLMRERALYQEASGSVRFLSPALFMTQVRLPATTPVGTYKAEVYLFGDGALLDTQSVQIFVHKSGVEQLITNMASEKPLLYGVLTVILAIFSGWFASVMFRRE